ncbi:caltractin ICL1f isoform X2 [Hydra vulgaris]|uniref:Caltractin ICL1f isoform X2 n=1 Tax=Hydra vulgaris TaxID=6087 RepID=A0ABM4CID6_HYDVU
MTSKSYMKYGDEIKLSEEQIQQIKQMFNLTDHQLNELYECFKLIDIDGSGKLTNIKLHKAISSLKSEVTLQDVEEIIEDINEEKKDKQVIEFIDFVKIMAKEIKEPLREEDVQNVFEIINVNKTGFVTSSDLYSVLTSFGFELTPTEIDATFKKYGDGLINFEEIKILTQQAHASILGPEDGFDEKNNIEEKKSDS